MIWNFQIWLRVGLWSFDSIERLGGHPSNFDIGDFPLLGHWYVDKPSNSKQVWWSQGQTFECAYIRLSFKRYCDLE